MKKAVSTFVNAVISALILLIFSACLYAQNPVSLSVTVKPVKAKAGEKLTARVSASISTGWHMYSVTQGAGGPTPTRITVADGPIKIAGTVRGSAPHREMDANFGIMTETYSGAASFSVPLIVDASAQPGAQTLTVNVRYQVCNDTTCLPPKTVKLSTAVEIITGAAVAAEGSPTPDRSPTATPTPAVANLAANTNKSFDPNANAATASAANASSEVSATAEENKGTSAGTASIAAPSPTTEAYEDSLWAFIWLAMTLGGLSLLTPCVFPMIPITVSYFANHSAGHRSKAVKLATVYSLGIVATFTLLGMLLAVFVGAAGINLFAANPWVNLLITAIFLFFAFNLFGAYEIAVPAKVLTRLDAVTRSREGEGGGIAGALLMGLTFTLTSFTCTSPFVGTLLVSASQGSWRMPLAGMLAYSAVFALPFFVLALVPQWISQLPRAGGWMNSVKVAMGFLEVAAAMKFLSNADLVWKWGVFTRDVVLAVWIAIGVILAFYLLGKFQLPHDSKPERIGAFRLASAVASLAIAFYLLTGLFGAKLGELESFLPPDLNDSTSSRLLGGGKGEPVWITNDYAAALRKAKQENKRVFIDFTGYTCTNCRWMEANIFPKKEVEDELNKFVLVRLYTDGEGAIYEKHLQMEQDMFGTVALPYYAVVDVNGKTTGSFPGLTRNTQEFVDFLKKAQEN